MDNILFDYDFEIEVKDSDKFYLSDILTNNHYKKWFNVSRTHTNKKGKIFILNKGRCGNGGTTGFINYAREHCKGLIVSVPNRSIVISKQKHDECCCVYGGSDNDDKEKNIRVCTWDKTNEVSNYQQFGFEYVDFFDMDSAFETPRFWSGSLLVVDEYHKLIDDSNYRDICNKLVKHILETDSNVLLMSATPNYEFIEFLRKYSGKDVETYNIKYSETNYSNNGHEITTTVSERLSIVPICWLDRKKGYKLYNIICKIIEESINRKKEYIEKPSIVGLKINHNCVFFNSIKDLTSIISNLPEEYKNEVEVLCAKTELNETTVPCYSENFNPEKQIHFMTSAYFTGMDVDTPIYSVYIVGGNSASHLAYSNKEIKQMLGRFRAGYERSFVISDGKVIDKFGYINAKSIIEKNSKRIEKLSKYMNDDDLRVEFINEFVNIYLEKLYNKGIVENLEGWTDCDSFIKMMSVYPEYKVGKVGMLKLKEYKRARDISFKKYKENRMKGVKLNYRYSAMCERFIEKFGLIAFQKASRNEIERKVKLDDKVDDDIDVRSLNKNELYDLLLGDGFYRGSYLMSVLDYLGEKCDFEMLETKIRDLFGAFCIYQKGDISKLRSCLFLCVLPNFTENPQKRGHGSIYKSVSPMLGENRNYIIRVSKKVSKRNQKTQAITNYIDNTKLYSMIEDGDKYQRDFFIKILADPAVIPNIKRDEECEKLFDYYKMNQTMISEFYKDTPITVKYPHKVEEMDKADCIIVDIDDSISFNEFKDIYSEYEWTAYPTISNTNNDNWTKFRVILPLAQTLSIPNENLNILKLLRRMVCKYEDKKHQLGSYINQEQWNMKRVNDGKVVDICQDTVIYLEALLKNLKTYDGKFKKVKKDGGFSTSNYWDMSRAITYYREHDKDGERHDALFVIKNRLLKEDCDVFEDWLWANYPSKMHHWKSHRRISD